VNLSRTIFRRSLYRRLVVGPVLLAYLVAAVGFPLQATAAKNDGDSFPCQGQRCGCQTADQCRRQCCCFSSVENFQKETTTADACCKADVSKSRPPGGRNCPIASPLRCQGVTVLWVAATTGFAPPPICDWQPHWPLVWNIETVDQTSCQFASLPSTPPPRHFAD
jgi:hypothetical protein